jgi:hypothetical protein
MVPNVMSTYGEDCFTQSPNQHISGVRAHLVRRRHYHTTVYFLNNHYSALLKETVIWMDCRAAPRTQLELTETQLINPSTARHKIYVTSNLVTP